MTREAADRYVAFLESMTPADLDRLGAFCAPEVRFRDPFNVAVGVAAYRRVLEKMFADVGRPDFVVTDRAQAGDMLCLRWRFAARGPGGSELRFEGMSDIRFDDAGRVLSHTDFWDAGVVYEKVPLLGGLIRLVRRRLRAG